MIIPYYSESIRKSWYKVPTGENLFEKLKFQQSLYNITF